MVRNAFYKAKPLLNRQKLKLTIKDKIGGMLWVLNITIYYEVVDNEEEHHFKK